MTKPKPMRSPPRRAGSFKADGDKWRRVVPSPMPKRIFEIRPIKWLLEKGVVVIARRRRRHSDDVRTGRDGISSASRR